MSPEEAREELDEAFKDFYFFNAANDYLSYSAIKAVFESKQAKDLINENPKNLHDRLMQLYYNDSELEKVLGMSYGEYYEEPFRELLMENHTLRKHLINMVKEELSPMPLDTYEKKLEPMKTLNQRVYHMLKPEEQDKILAGMLAEMKSVRDGEQEGMLIEHLSKETQELEERNRALKQELKELLERQQEDQQEEARREMVDDDIPEPEAEAVIPAKDIPGTDNQDHQAVTNNQEKINKFKKFVIPVNQSTGSRTRSTNLPAQGSQGSRHIP